MSKHAATSSTQTVFDVFGSYLVDVFYNGHYNLAKERVRSGVASSITDDYRTQVLAFVTAPTVSATYYTKLVMLWLDYYRRYAIGGALLLADFQDKILSQFIPAKFYADFSERQKDDAFRAIVVKTLTDFGDCILAPDMLKRVIDDRANPHNVSLLQGRMDTILMNQRDAYYAQFARKLIRPTQTQTDRVAMDMMNMQLDKLKRAFVEEKRAHCELKIEHTRAQNIIRALTARLADLSPGYSAKADPSPPSYTASADPSSYTASADAKVDPPPVELAAEHNLGVSAQVGRPTNEDWGFDDSSEEEPAPDADARRAAMLAQRVAAADDTGIREILDDDLW